MEATGLTYYTFGILISGKAHKLGISFTVNLLPGHLSLLGQFGKLSLGNFHLGIFQLRNEQAFLKFHEDFVIVRK